MGRKIPPALTPILYNNSGVVADVSKPIVLGVANEASLQDSLQLALTRLDDILTMSPDLPGNVREQLNQIRGELTQIAQTPEALRTPQQATMARMAAQVVQTAVAQTQNGMTDNERRVAMSIMFAALSPEAQARIGIRSSALNESSYHAFALSFYDDLPQDQQTLLGGMFEDFLRSERGQELSRQWNALPPEIRQQVAVQEEITRVQAQDVVASPLSTPEATAEVTMAIADQGLADDDTAQAIASIEGSIRRGQRPRTEDVTRLRGCNERRMAAMAEKIPEIVGHLPTTLRTALDGKQPREILDQGRDVMRDPERRAKALDVLKAVQANPNLTPEQLAAMGFTPEQIQDAAAVDAYSLARSETHLESMRDRGRGMQQGQGQGQQQNLEPGQGQNQGQNPTITDSSQRGHIKVDQTMVTQMQGMHLADVNGNGFDRADIDAALERLRQSGVTLDADHNNWLDASALSQLSSVASLPTVAPPAKTQPVSGRTGP